MNQMKRITTAAVTLASVLSFIVGTQTAQAKTLIFKSGSLDTPAEAFVIKHPDSATTIFGRLQNKDDLDYFSITAEEGTTLEISLDTVKNDGDFNPIMIFYGPELPKPSEDPVIDLGSGNGAMILRVEADSRESRREKFFFTDFYTGPKLKIKIPKTATYGMAIKSPNGKLGRYILDIKGKDEFNLNDLPGHIFDLIKAILRMY